ncbi:MFS transporter [Xylanimonas protaetiae]|uniref:MFS transporter n=1 Tax=Xylanimonas protaetiae TaxID=2509457 RepID=A0A4V0YGF0_9MICO|nr:MFS transporter [Xylanimonas protaetiae]QAY70981.1 MFS transporter [Xylanimonas protaetiae]
MPRSRLAPWFVWAAGMAVYVLAVAHRSSFGVAGLDAAARFDVPATVLSLFAVLQLGTYALMQLPMGMALDAWGPRRLLTSGAVLMAAGQVGMAFAPNVGVAIAVRVLLGTGDAAVFISVLRLVWSWFEPRRVPLLTQLTGLVGQLGQVVSAVPFALALHRFGWAPAFTAMALVGGLTAVAAAVGVRPGPQDEPPLRRGLEGLGAALTSPGTWLGFFAHLLGGVSINTFLLMWGVPFLVEGQGLSTGQAGALLSLSTGVAIVAGPVVGEFTARHPLHRTWGTLSVTALTCAAWALVLLPTTPRPFGVLVLFTVLVSVGGPSALIGMDLAASFNPPERRGTAQGVANMGGFLSAVLVMLAVGVVLDHRSPGGTPSLADYRAALSVVLAPIAVGVVGVLVTRRRVRAAAGIVVPTMAELWERRRS